MSMSPLVSFLMLCRCLYDFQSFADAINLNAAFNYFGTSLIKNRLP